MMRSLLLIMLLPVMVLVGCTSQTKSNLPESNRSLAHNAGGEDESDGIGGTGLQSEGDGLGGTGMLAESDGIGGTGIIGPISGFGSIIVNGMHIDYPPEMPITLNGERASTEELKIGRVVEVHARSAVSGLAAHTITIMDAVVGPIEAINRADGTLRVLGQTVYLDRETVLFSNLDIPGTLKSLKRGDLLRVSGLHLASGSLVATRVELAKPDARWFVTGRVRELTTEGFSIGGLRVKRDAEWPGGLQDGRLAQVQGEQVGDHFLGQNLLVKPDTPFNGMVERLVIQGYPRPATHAGALRIGNLQMDMPADSAVKENNLRMPLIHQRIQLTAHIGSNGVAHAEQVVAIRSVPSAAVSRLRPDTKLPSMPRRDFEWNRTPNQSVPKSSVRVRPVRPKDSSINRSVRPTPSTGMRFPKPPQTAKPPGIRPIPNLNRPVTGSAPLRGR